MKVLYKQLESCKDCPFIRVRKTTTLQAYHSCMELRNTRALSYTAFLELVEGFDYVGSQEKFCEL